MAQETLERKDIAGQQEVEVDTKVKIASQVGDASLNGAQKVARFYSIAYQKVVGAFASLLSNKLYTDCRDFMLQPSTKRVQLILIGIMQFLITVFAAIFTAIDDILYGLADYITALVQSQHGKGAGTVTRAVLGILISVFKIAVSLSIVGIKGIIIALPCYLLIRTTYHFFKGDLKKGINIVKEAI